MRDYYTNRWPAFRSERASIWHHGIETSDVVNEKIHAAFGNVKIFPLERIIFQLWRPITTSSGARVLSSSGTPFALSLANNRLKKYRLRCCMYYYGIIGVVADDPMIISDAPPSMAFLKQFPEVVLDLKVHRGTPLVDLALECELTCFMMLPLFYEGSCVGVVEVSVRYPRHLIVMYNELHREVKRVGLSIARPKAISLPYRAMPSELNLAGSEVTKALRVVVQSHGLTLAQVWNPYVNYQDWMKGVLLGKLGSYAVVNLDGMSLLKHFYFDLLYLPLRNGPALIASTFETRQPHLCRNIHKFTANKGLMAILSANTNSTCFVICLRSSHTGRLDHLFEFFWPQRRNHLALIEALVLTLKQHLPSFKYDSGAQLGDELLVVDVDVDVENSSSQSGSTLVKIFPENNLSDTSKALEETRTLVGMKRKSIEGQSELNQTNDQYPLDNINNQKGEEDDDDLVILAVYKVDHSLLFLPSSPTFESLMEKIKQEFELNPSGTYKIKYQVLTGEWYSLTDDACLRSCISSYRASKNIDHIKLLVLAVVN